ncbi:DUF2489 domain-containing protein [Marinobacter sp. SS21]|uniref:DUF2489 domain-containing protein n=1 Tax=Marinobacter sp. SS21 TaxID=2979460 RepID=UPI00232F4666|nr:DUF2489 domain-containing protein [Marinobacter sp. SS21]MDC0663989.1 DUF2489 domain-containing protein [Marinobacter sp. SS21]
MPIGLQWTLIVLGLIAIVLLAAFIGRQLRLLRKDKALKRKHAAFQAQRRTQIVESIRVLAMAIEENQVEYSEACLRLKGLLELIDPELLTQAPYQVFQQVHDQIQHMPTHQTRQDTDLKFIRKLDKDRFAIESQHAEAIQRAASALRQHPF